MANENVIILEDLILKGYRLIEDKTGLDLPHAKVVLGKLAKFHAMSAVLHTKVKFHNFPFRSPTF